MHTNFFSDELQCALSVLPKNEYIRATAKVELARQRGEAVMCRRGTKGC